RFELVRFELVRFELVRFELVRFELVRFELVVPSGFMQQKAYAFCYRKYTVEKGAWLYYGISGR
ncbi:MAG: hypothetical protein K2P25_05215, partial [Lachnospiraceae bacterium]|nr:hypothetical protein [Lachnospiraceae bacterium]